MGRKLSRPQSILALVPWIPQAACLCPAVALVLLRDWTAERAGVMSGGPALGIAAPQQNVTAALAAAPYSDTSQSIVNAKVAALLQNMAPAPPLPPVGKYVKVQDLAR